MSASRQLTRRRRDVIVVVKLSVMLIVVFVIVCLISAAAAVMMCRGLDAGLKCSELLSQFNGLSHDEAINKYSAFNSQ